MADLESERDAMTWSEPENEPESEEVPFDPDADAESDALAETATSPEALESVSLADRSAWGVGSEDLREARERRHRSRIGRVDLSVIWRRATTASTPIRDELWLVGTWRL